MVVRACRLLPTVGMPVLGCHQLSKFISNSLAEEARHSHSETSSSSKRQSEHYVKRQLYE